LILLRHICCRPTVCQRLSCCYSAAYKRWLAFICRRAYAAIIDIDIIDADAADIISHFFFTPPFTLLICHDIDVFVIRLLLAAIAFMLDAAPHYC